MSARVCNRMRKGRSEYTVAFNSPGGSAARSTRDVRPSELSGMILASRLVRNATCRESSEFPCWRKTAEPGEPSSAYRVFPRGGEMYMPPNAGGEEIKTGTHGVA